MRQRFFVSSLSTCIYRMVKYLHFCSSTELTTFHFLGSWTSHILSEKTALENIRAAYLLVAVATSMPLQLTKNPLAQAVSLFAERLCASAKYFDEASVNPNLSAAIPR